MKTVEISTDGACRGNPGPGGWAALVRDGDQERELCGYDPATTNNRMELMSTIEALASLSESSGVILMTDSLYVKDGITTWIHGWKKNGWRRADKGPVKNIDLWQRLDELVGRHQVTWKWVKGHSGHVENDRVDELARQQITLNAIKNAVVRDAL